MSFQGGRLIVSSQVWGSQRSHDAPAVHHAIVSWPIPGQAGAGEVRIKRIHQHASGRKSPLSSGVGSQEQGMGSADTKRAIRTDPSSERRLARVWCYV